MIASLLLLVSSLAALSGHRDVDALVERIISASRGGEGLDRRDVDLLRRWASRWSLVHPEVRRFYAEALSAEGRDPEDSDAVVAGVRCLLDGYTATPTTRWRLARLHVDLLGLSPGRDLTQIAL